VARAEEIENLAEEVRAESKAIRLLRERVTLLRRDIVKMIATGLEEASQATGRGCTCAMRRYRAASCATYRMPIWRRWRANLQH